MFISIGNWVLRPLPGSMGYGPPTDQFGAIAQIDLGRTPEMGVATEYRRGLLMFSVRKPPSEWTVIASGHPSEAKIDAIHRSAIASNLGMKSVEGDSVADMLLWLAGDGSDPDGHEAPATFGIDRDNRLRIFLGGPVADRKIDWGSKHGDKLLGRLKRDLTSLRVESQSGKLRLPVLQDGKQIGTQVDGDFHRRRMQHLIEKHGLPFDALRPNDWPENETPLDHSTTLTESFNTADSSTLGPDQTWYKVDITGTLAVVSNLCERSNTVGYAAARCEADLSSDDHYAQIKLVRQDLSGSLLGPITRFETIIFQQIDGYCGFAFNGDNKYYFEKFVASTPTLLNTPVAITIAANDILKTQSSGSTHTIYQNGTLKDTVSDSAITGHLRQGFVVYHGATGANLSRVDAFESSDLSPPLTAGTVETVAVSSTAIDVNCTGATGGTAPYSAQLERAPDVAGAPGSFSNVGSPQTGVADGDPLSVYHDTGLTTNTFYWYRYTFTDSAAATSTTAAVQAYTRVGSIYYIANSGSDSNDGLSTGAPFQTISHLNSFGVVAGDSFLFKRGDTFSGTLNIHPILDPTPSQRITVGDYGTGAKPIIDADDGDGVHILNCGYVTVKNLRPVGSGINLSGSFPTIVSTTTSTGAGVTFECDTEDVWYRGIVIDGVDTTDMQDGIRGLSSFSQATAAFDNFRITNCRLGTIGRWGITTLSVGNGGYNWNVNYVFKNYYVGDCDVEDNTGLSAEGVVGGSEERVVAGTAFSFFPLSSTDAVWERCTNCTNPMQGRGSPNTGVSGGVALYLTVYCQRVIARGCIIGNAIDPAGIDGLGIDIDLGSLDCVAEDCVVFNCTYNYTVLAASSDPHDGTIIRRCIGENGTTNELKIASNCGTVQIYHNTFYNTVNEVLLITTGSTSILIANNNFSALAFGTDLGTVSHYYGNVWNVLSGGSFTIEIGGVDYTSLADMQEAGKEKIGSELTGAEVVPGYDDPGNFDTSGIVVAAQASNYDVPSNSPSLGVGVDLQQFDVQVSGHDLHGNPIYGSSTADNNGITSGALAAGSEFGGGSSSGGGLIIGGGKSGGFQRS